MHWPTKPVIYQINTWVWLATLSQKYKRKITLKNVPDKELDHLAAYGVDAVWLMGVWARSPVGREMAKQYIHEYRPALPDITPDDIVGSPYAIYDYEVDDHLGGRKQLAHLRGRLRIRGLLLILDFVPNHVALDHHWVQDHPHYLMQGTARDLKRRPSDFYAAKDAWGRTVVVAHGRDPYFPGWADTAQVNAFNPLLRQAMCDTVRDIASQCDGVRCDMAMLLNTEIFKQTWTGFYDEEAVPETEFWTEIIPPVKADYPDFKFIAEVYWNMESDLQQLGFDFTYDKMLYDRITGHTPADVRAHLLGDIEFQKRLVRFIENHDEPRAYTALGPDKSRPAITLAATLPGALLLHDGQFTGRRAKLPVQIGRQPEEPVDEALETFYKLLLRELRADIYQTGQWIMFGLFPAWSHNDTYDNIIAHGWRSGGDFRLIVVNLTGIPSQGLVNLAPWRDDLAGCKWQLDDVLNGTNYMREGDRMLHPGLYIDLPPYQLHIFSFECLEC